MCTKAFFGFGRFGNVFQLNQAVLSFQETFTFLLCKDFDLQVTICFQDDENRLLWAIDGTSQCDENQRSF